MSFTSSMTGAFAILLALGLVAVWVLMPPEAMPARFQPGDCRKLEIIDGRTGAVVVGAEDLALAPDGDRIIFSAHDRRDPARPPGGLYAISLWESTGARRVTAERVDAVSQREGVFRPHGIALSEDGGRLAVINRPGPNRATVELGSIDRRWRPVDLIEETPLCRANDLVFTGRAPNELLITLDRTDCFPSMRDLSPWSTSGRLARTDGETFVIDRTGLAFPNGLDREFVAETRAKRLSRADGLTITLPGGPDNITSAENGDLILAVHPKLGHVWMALRGWRDRAPSRIIKVDPESGDIEVLFDDPMGEIYSAATAAVLSDGRLVAGSVVDNGLLLCGKGL